MTDYKWIRRLAEMLSPGSKENSRTDFPLKENAAPRGVHEGYRENGSERNMIRKHFTFHGRVQGVGFRYRACRAAEMAGCTGWVRNEYDGSVTMEIQGREPDMDRVLGAIREGRFIRIEEIREEIIAEEPGEYGCRTD